MKRALVPVACLAVLTVAVAEELVLTTYYPSPRGVYKALTVTDRVGIGTSTPFGTLHVRGGGQALMLQGTPMSENSDIQFYRSADTSGNFRWNLTYRADRGNDDLQLTRNAAGGGPVMVMAWKNRTGDVGIGTDDPSEKLEINGNVRLSGDPDNPPFRIQNVANPVSAHDVATKQWVEAASGGGLKIVKAESANSNNLTMDCGTGWVAIQCGFSSSTVASGAGWPAMYRMAAVGYAGHYASSGQWIWSPCMDYAGYGQQTISTGLGADPYYALYVKTAAIALCTKANP